MLQAGAAGTEEDALVKWLNQKGCIEWGIYHIWDFQQS
jgi:hypothetical protein